MFLPYFMHICTLVYITFIILTLIFMYIFLNLLFTTFTSFPMMFISMWIYIRSNRICSYLIFLQLPSLCAFDLFTLFFCSCVSLHDVTLITGSLAPITFTFNYRRLLQYITVFLDLIGVTSLYFIYFSCIWSPLSQFWWYSKKYHYILILFFLFYYVPFFFLLRICRAPSWCIFWIGCSLDFALRMLSGFTETPFRTGDLWVQSSGIIVYFKCSLRSDIFVHLYL